jgi:microcystin-dependent protein
MALETGTYISDLVPANPVGSDPIAFADDHLRLIKSTLKATFPTMKAPLTATVENLNNGTPVGLIAMWSGATLPSGWTLCNGVAVALSDGTGNITPPDLRDRFVIASGGSYAIGAKGGAVAISLSQANMPAHTHAASMDAQGNHAHTLHDPGHVHGPQAGAFLQHSAAQGLDYNVRVDNTSANARDAGVTAAAFTGVYMDAAGSHAHNISIGSAGNGAAFDIRNPYYALAFIMKV